ncbi:hypothetical protein D3C78_1683680 [compost metagenome]
MEMRGHIRRQAKQILFIAAYAVHQHQQPGRGALRRGFAMQKRKRQIGQTGHGIPFQQSSIRGASPYPDIMP